MRRKYIPATRTLTDRQKYLLNRIPARYDLQSYVEPEPPAVKRARALVSRYDKAFRRRQCQHDKRSEALIRKAKEAVYFESEEKALAIVQQCEKMLKSCGD